MTFGDVEVGDLLLERDGALAYLIVGLVPSRRRNRTRTLTITFLTIGGRRVADARSYTYDPEQDVHQALEVLR